jgi:hypothetical protein
MQAVLYDTVPGKQIWGMSGIDNSIVSRSAWANRIQLLSKVHLGSPRTGDENSLKSSLTLVCYAACKHLSCYALLLTDGVCNDVGTD